jgi:hypothetical protein
MNPTQSIPLDAEGVARMRLPIDGRIDLSIPSGDVRIQGADGDQVVVRSRNGEPLDRLVEIVETDRAIVIRNARDREHRLGFLRLTTGPDVELDVEVPRGVSISTRTASAGVSATGLDGESRWTSASGRVRLAIDGGSATVETASGQVEVRAGADVTLACRTVSGDVDIRAETIADLACRTVSGDVGVRAGLLAAARIDTTSGDVALDGRLGTGPHEVGTLSGSVRITTDAEVRLEARTVAGRIDIRLPHRAEGSGGSRVVIVGAGSVPLRAQTLSGDIDLRAPRGATGDAASSSPRDLAVPPPPEPQQPPTPKPADATGADPRAAEASPPESFRGAGTDRREAARLEVLRALERGDLDVDVAMRRLAGIDDAGPLQFRGSVL